MVPATYTFNGKGTPHRESPRVPMLPAASLTLLQWVAVSVTQSLSTFISTSCWEVILVPNTPDSHGSLAVDRSLRPFI